MIISALDSVLLLEREILLVERVDTVNHGLHQLHLAVAQAVLVRDIVGDTSLATGLAAGAPWLKGQLLTPLLQGGQAFLRPAGQVNMHTGAHASAQVGGAGVQVAILGVQQELLATLCLDRVAHGLDAPGQTVKDATNISSLLHGDDPQLVLLIDPDKEAFGIVVVDAPALRPVTLHAGGNQVLVTGHEEEVVIHQLLPGLLLHAQQWVVGARQILLQLAKSALHQGFNGQALLLGDARAKAKSINGPAHTDASGLDRCVGVNVALDLSHVHVGGVLEVLAEAMVLQDERVEDRVEDLVGVSVAGVDAAMLVVELDGASDCLRKVRRNV